VIGAVILLIAATALLFRPLSRRALIYLGTPVLVGLVLLGWFNKVRFHAWTEFGTTYQVTSVAKPSWTMKYVLPNVYSYLLRKPYFSCDFPFVSTSWYRSADAFPSGLVMPSGYVVSEPTIGLLWVAPWFFFGGVALIGLLALLRLAWMNGRLGPRHQRLCWLVMSAIVLTAGSGVAMLGMPLATMRFSGDIATGLSLLSVVGFLWMLRALDRWRRWAYWGALSIGGLVATYTVVAGLLLGVEGYYGYFRANNPALYQRLSDGLSMGCR
jgi:hypothetical protein